MRWCTLLVLLGCGSQPTGPRYADPINEPSGLVASRQHPGIFWTHNDSGDSARLFAVQADGALVATVRVHGADNVDWEDIAADDAGYIYIADIGNNRSNRRDLRVYRLPEPDPRGAAHGQVDRVIPFHYPEQTGWPDASRNFDAEALFWDRGRLFLLTKHRSNLETRLYRFDDLSGARDLALTQVGRFVVGGDPKRFGGRVTGADLSPDGQHLAVLTYHAVFLFARPTEDDDFLGRLVKRIDLDQGVLKQCEAVAWTGADLLISNEDQAIFRLPDPLGRAVTRFGGR